MYDDTMGRDSEIRSTISAMLPAIEAERESAWQALSVVEGNIYGQQAPWDDRADDRALASSLRRFYRIMLATMEMAGLHELCADHARCFDAFEEVLSDIEMDHDVGTAYSRPLAYLEDTYETMQILAGDESDVLSRARRDLLYAVLRKTGHIVQSESKQPRNERDVRDVMHRYLQPVFPDYTRMVTISGAPKSFKPDGGVRRLGVAIEFKFADSREEAKRALSELYTDESGYRGSDDWPLFVAVIYQTNPFIDDEQLDEELQRVQARSVTVIPVVGPGGRQRRAGPG